MKIKPPPPKKALTLDPLPTPEAAKPLTKKADGANAPLNFKVDPAFKRQFKAYAALRDESMIDILIRAVTREMKENG